MRTIKSLSKYSPLIISIIIHITVLVAYQILNIKTHTNVNLEIPRNSEHQINFDLRQKGLKKKVNFELLDNQNHQELKKSNSENKPIELINTNSTNQISSKEFSGANNNGAKIQLTEPEYPKMARLKNQEGSVLLWVKFDDLGNSTTVKIIESSHNVLLDEAALKAASQWKVPPKSLTELTKKIIFKLNEN